MYVYTYVYMYEYRVIMKPVLLILSWTTSTPFQLCILMQLFAFSICKLHPDIIITGGGMINFLSTTLVSNVSETYVDDK